MSWPKWVSIDFGSPGKNFTIFTKSDAHRDCDSFNLFNSPEQSCSWTLASRTTSSYHVFSAFWEYPEPHKYLATPILTFTAHDSQRKGWHFIFQLFCCLSHSLVKSHLLVFSDPPNYIPWSWRKNRILTPTAMVLGATVKFSMPFSVTKTLSYCWHRVSGASDRGSENLSGDRKWMHHLCIVKCYNLPITSHQECFFHRGSLECLILCSVEASSLLSSIFRCECV